MVQSPVHSFDRDLEKHAGDARLPDLGYQLAGYEELFSDMHPRYFYLILLRGISDKDRLHVGSRGVSS